MIVEYIRYKVAPERRQQLVEAYQQAAFQLDVSPECLAYELSECTEEPGRFVLRIEWESASAHMNGFRRSAVFPAFFANIRAFVNDIEEMRHYELTPVVSGSQPE
jgi:quinol monooxygenase YgiN